VNLLEVDFFARKKENVLEIAQPAVGEPQADDIGDDRADKANEEEETEIVVDLALRELPSSRTGNFQIN